VDILPTVLDVAGLPAGSYDGPGSSILRRLADGAATEEAYSYSEADGRCRLRRAFVSARYKYIFTPDRPGDRLLLESPRFFDELCSTKPVCKHVAREELYDLSVDPFEERNLLQGSLSQGESFAVDRLRAVLIRHQNLPPAYRHRLTLGDTSPDVPDDSTREALRALGYIE
jgi:hypothetical protein